MKPGRPYGSSSRSRGPRCFIASRLVDPGNDSNFRVDGWLDPTIN